jgi:hypothetical protein
MWIERRMFAIIDEHWKGITSKNSTRQMSSIKIDVAINYVIFGKIPKKNGRWTVDLRSMFLLNDAPIWTLVSVHFPECPNIT